MDIKLLAASQNYTNKKMAALSNVPFNSMVLDKKADELDFVRMIQPLLQGNISYRLLAQNKLGVSVPISDEEYAIYELFPDQYDGLIRLWGVSAAVSDPASTNVVQEMNYQDKTGTWVTLYPPNHYTTEIGATFIVTFKGTGFEFRHYADNRGGIWRFSIQGQPDVYISTFSVTAGPKSQTIYSGLPNDVYTVVATFMGEDLENPPSETARGWCIYDSSLTNATIGVYGEGFTVTQNIIENTSNKEFAIQVKPSGSQEAVVWIPYHGIPVSEFVYQGVYIDGREVKDWTNRRWQTAEHIRVFQVANGYHPSDPVNPLLTYTLNITITSFGYDIRGIIDFKQPTYVEKGYNLMLPAATAFGKACVTSKGVRYPTIKTDSSETFISTASNSAAFIDPEQDYVAAMTLFNFDTTMRTGRTGFPTNPNKIWHRPTDQKFYCQPFEQATMPVGATYQWGGRFCVGILPDANSKLPQ